MRVVWSQVAAVLVIAMGAVAPVGVAGASSSPALRLGSTKPLVVRGVGFSPGERVTLRAVTREGSKLRRLTATAAGTFVARFAISGDVCALGLLRVVAVGARGSRAVLRLPAGACQPLGVA